MSIEITFSTVQLKCTLKKCYNMTLNKQLHLYRISIDFWVSFPKVRFLWYRKTQSLKDFHLSLCMGSLSVTPRELLHFHTAIMFNSELQQNLYLLSKWTEVEYRIGTILVIPHWVSTHMGNLKIAHVRACVPCHISKMPEWIHLIFYSLITYIPGVVQNFSEFEKVEN